MLFFHSVSIGHSTTNPNNLLSDGDAHNKYVRKTDSTNCIICIVFENFLFINIKISFVTTDWWTVQSICIVNMVNRLPGSNHRVFTNHRRFTIVFNYEKSCWTSIFDEFIVTDNEWRWVNQYNNTFNNGIKFHFDSTNNNYNNTNNYNHKSTETTSYHVHK